MKSAGELLALRKGFCLAPCLELLIRLFFNAITERTGQRLAAAKQRFCNCPQLFLFFVCFNLFKNRFWPQPLFIEPCQKAESKSKQLWNPPNHCSTLHKCIFCQCFFEVFSFCHFSLENLQPFSPPCGKQEDLTGKTHPWDAFLSGRKQGFCCPVALKKSGCVPSSSLL